MAVEGDILDYLLSLSAPLCERAAISYFVQLMNVLQHCHSRNIYHLDIKPENLLLDQRFCLKLTDFGVSKHQTGLLNTFVGTANYMAPEIVMVINLTNYYYLIKFYRDNLI